MVKKKYKKSFRQHWQEEKERMRDMTAKERLEHLWTYYKEYLWIAAVVVILICATITSLINLIFKDSVITGMMVNVTVEQRGMNYLSEDYAEKLGVNPRWKEVKVEYTAFGSLEDPNNSEQNYYAAMTVESEVSAKMLDYLILDEESMLFYLNREVYLDLRDFFSEEELAQLEEEGRLFHLGEEGSDDWEIVAVDITQLPYVQDNITSEGKVYFALSGSTEKLEACRDLWEYLHQWESPAEPEATTLPAETTAATTAENG